MKYSGGKYLGMLCLWICLMLFCISTQAQSYSIVSPNGLLKISVEVSSSISYEVIYNDAQVLKPSEISMTLNDTKILGKYPVIIDTDTREVNEELNPLFGKNKVITNNFNERTIHFEGDFDLIFRAYNEGVAYRFVTSMENEVCVTQENANFNFASTPSVIFPEADATMRSWERDYTTFASLGDITNDQFAITPTLFTLSEPAVRVVIAESDLYDYPGMYVQRNGSEGVMGKWAHYPKTVSDPDDLYAYHRVTERENFLARTAGTRNYPWRVVIVAKDDKELLNNELIYKLARPSVLSNTSWIKPGKSAWEWWHDAILETVSIPSGIDHLGLKLYKYYVDFAAENKLEYVTLDAGWGIDYVAQLCEYAKSKNVKVILWDFINLPIENPGRLTQLKSLGASGVKVDLIERDDQVAINWLEKLAQECAERELVVLFHGCPKPTGLQRTYPNILNFEAVRGAETTKWDDTADPDYHLQFPFIRMLAGPLDYTPGSMRNVHHEEFTPTPQGIPKTIGSRSHELAMYVLFDNPLAYLCDSPTEYRKFPDIMKYLSAVPTTWDKTIPIQAEVGKYAVIRKQHGDDWFAAAMTNEEGRNISIDLDFLPDNTVKMADIYRDNEETVANAKAYTHESVPVNNQSHLQFDLSKGGGMVLWIHDAVTGLVDPSTQPDLRIFPNREKTRLIIQPESNLMQIQIIDYTGKVYYNDETKHQQSTGLIDISWLDPGLYIVRLATSTQTYSTRFFK